MDVTANAGLGSAQLTAAAFGSGLAAGDVDGDGDMDLVVSAPQGAPLRLYRNLGNLQFRDDTATAGLGNATAMITGMTFGDIDNDGDSDLYVCNWSSPPSMFVNDGTGAFVDQASAFGLTHLTSNYSANFGDYDRDGWLDLYLGNRATTNGRTTPGDPNILYRNFGGGTRFIDVSVQAGVDNVGMTYASAFVDFDEDGWLDILVVNDKGARLLPNELYRNLGNGTFQPVGALHNANSAINGMGVDYTDAFCDGGIDLMQSDSAPWQHLLTWNNGSYVNRTQQSGMFSFSDGWAVHFADVNNDGWPDVHVVNTGAPNSLFVNPGLPWAAAAAWPDLAAASGLAGYTTGFTTVVADFDNDGDLDFCHRNEVAGPGPQSQALNLLRNSGPTANWIKFRTRGTVSNRDGIGARITVRTGNHEQRQWVRSGTGFISSSDPRLHFGLGAAMQADVVTVLWPSGQQQALENIAGNQIVEVVEPSFVLDAPVGVGGSSVLTLQSPNESGRLYAMVLAFDITPPSPISGGRNLPVALDALSGYTIVPGNVLLSQPLGNLDATGRATSGLSIPNQAFLQGLTLYATAATFGPTGFPDVATIFPTAVTITIQ